MRRGGALPNMGDLGAELLDGRNSSSSIASSGVNIGITAAGVSRSLSLPKYSWVTRLKPRQTARRVASSGMRGHTQARRSDR